MSNTKTGLLSALGAVLGGAAGAAAGHYATKSRGVRYFKSRRNVDAVVVGGAAGAVVGAFIGGAVGAEDPAPSRELPPR